MATEEHSDAIVLLLHHLFRPTENTIPVIHPSFKALGRIWVPWAVLLHTNGLERAVQGHANVPSLCALFQSGRCNAKERCNQVHVHREWAATVWHALELASRTNCCQSCGDFPSICHGLFDEFAGEEVTLKVPGGPAVSFPIEKVAATRFWHQSLEEQGMEFEFSPHNVCMLHQQDYCKYGVECKNVHLCRHVWREMVTSLRLFPEIEEDDDFANLLLEPIQPATSTEAEEFKRSQPLPIIDPNSGKEVAVIEGSSSEALVDAQPIVPQCNPQVQLPQRACPSGPLPQRAPGKRVLHALAIVDPKSGEELPFQGAVRPTSRVEPADVLLVEPMLQADAPAAEVAAEVMEHPTKSEVRRIPTLEAMCEYDYPEDSTKKAPQWSHQLETVSGMSDASRETASGGTPGSPASSIGSDCASSASSAFIGRSFPKPGSALKAKAREGPGSFGPRDADRPSWGRKPRGGESREAWASKMEASRGVLKKLSTGLLGVVLTEGPQPRGFAAGRGCPLA